MYLNSFSKESLGVEHGSDEWFQSDEREREREKKSSESKHFSLLRALFPQTYNLITMETNVISLVVSHF